jgi:enamine deaminase RidA (YjgF/YER057c/UK114 family)
LTQALPPREDREENCTTGDAMSAFDYEAILPAGWERARGFSYGVVARGSRILRVAGQIASEKGTGGVEAGLDFGAQWERALGNVVTVVEAAGGAAERIVMLRAFVTDLDAFRSAGAALGAGWRAHLGKHFPAMTLVEVSRLVDPNALVEIEAEAVLD